MNLPHRRSSQRALALLVIAAGLTLAGTLASWPAKGRPPAPCASPVLAGALLVCDGEGAAPGARAWLAGGRLDLNRASPRELARVPGVGPTLAEAIVAERRRRGGFATLAELDEVRGVGPKKLAALARFVEARPQRDATRGARPVSTVPKATNSSALVFAGSPPSARRR